MTGRRENPLPTEDAPPALVALAARLRELRAAVGNPTYRQMGYTAFVSAPALSQAASGKKMPSWTMVLSYLKACEVQGEKAVVDELNNLWKAARAEDRQQKKAHEQPDALPSPAAASVILVKGTGPDRRFGDLDLQETKEWDLGAYTQALGKLRSDAELTVRELMERSQIPTRPGQVDSDLTAVGKVVQLKRSTIYDVLNGRIRPSVEFTRAYLRACGLTRDQVQIWIELLTQLLDAQSRVDNALHALTKPKHQFFGKNTERTGDTPWGFELRPTNHKVVMAIVSDQPKPAAQWHYKVVDGSPVHSRHADDPTHEHTTQDVEAAAEPPAVAAITSAGERATTNTLIEPPALVTDETSIASTTERVNGISDGQVHISFPVHYLRVAMLVLISISIATLLGLVVSQN